METLLSPLMDDLRACLCTALADTVGGDPSCFCALVPGREAPADWCTCSGAGGCGMAWVRLDSLYASGDRFPAQDGTTRALCAKVLAAVIEVGVYRCLPTNDQRGNPPGPVAQTQAALVATDDAMAIASAILCCESVTKRSYLLGRYTPSPPSVCGGGAWTVTVQLTRRS